MGNNNLMIRMIDVVFILLFGFIAVSQIGSAVAIDPPKSKEADKGAPKETRIVVIGVKKNGTFPVGGGERVLKNERQLAQYLNKVAAKARADGVRLGVRIRSNWDAKIQYGLTVARICRDLGIPKGLDVVQRNF